MKKSWNCVFKFLWEPCFTQLKKIDSLFISVSLKGPHQDACSVYIQHTFSMRKSKQSNRCAKQRLRSACASAHPDQSLSCRELMFFPICWMHNKDTDQTRLMHRHFLVLPFTSSIGSETDCRSRGCEFDPDQVPYFQRG